MFISRWRSVNKFGCSSLLILIYWFSYPYSRGPFCVWDPSSLISFVSSTGQLCTIYHVVDFIQVSLLSIACRIHWTSRMAINPSSLTEALHLKYESGSTSQKLKAIFLLSTLHAPSVVWKPHVFQAPTGSRWWAFHQGQYLFFPRAFCVFPVHLLYLQVRNLFLTVCIAGFCFRSETHSECSRLRFSSVF